MNHFLRRAGIIWFSLCAVGLAVILIVARDCDDPRLLASVARTPLVLVGGTIQPLATVDYLTSPAGASFSAGVPTGNGDVQLMTINGSTYAIDVNSGAPACTPGNATGLCVTPTSGHVLASMIGCAAGNMIVEGAGGSGGTGWQCTGARVAFGTSTTNWLPVTAASGVVNDSHIEDTNGLSVTTAAGGGTVKFSIAAATGAAVGSASIGFGSTGTSGAAYLVPTGTAPAINTCTGGTITAATSTDTSGQVSFSVSGTGSCSINFASTVVPRARAPICVCSSAAAGTTVSALACNASAATLTITATALASDTINWVCI